MTKAKANLYSDATMIDLEKEIQLQLNILKKQSEKHTDEDNVVFVFFDVSTPLKNVISAAG